MRLGVFGGTFDPIHYGHLRLAEEARCRFQLDRVLFVPNWISPFKTGRAVTPGVTRAELVQAAIADNPAFALDTRELERPGPSYTVETMRALHDENPGTEMFFLTGADAVRDLAKWREPETLLALTRFVAATRFGVSREETTRALPPAWVERILFLEMPALDISGTDLRERVQTERSIRYLTPPAVRTLIYERGLYHPTEPTRVP